MSREAAVQQTDVSLQAIPERYSKHKLAPIDEYFAMGRGHQKEGVDVPSLVR